MIFDVFNYISSTRDALLALIAVEILTYPHRQGGNILILFSLIFRRSIPGISGRLLSVALTAIQMNAISASNGRVIDRRV